MDPAALSHATDGSALALNVRRDIVIAREMESLGLLRPWLYCIALEQPARAALAESLRGGPVHSLLGE